MMQAMRDRVKLIYWIVIVSFVGLMFLVWGIGLDRNRGGKRKSRTEAVVATVNNRDISYEEWNNRVQSILGQMRQQQANNELTENQILRARNQAYDQLVRETLQRIEADKIGITVTDDEIVDMLSNNPPAYLLNQFRDENGKIDYEAYYQALNNPNLPWRLIEDGLRESLPLQKLLQLVQGRALVGETEIREAFLAETQKALAEYIAVPFTDIEMPEGEVSDEDVQAYYDAHLQDYKLPPRAVVRLVRVAKEASPEDQREILSILGEIRQEIVDGNTTFANAAQTYSEDTSAAEGGDLGFLDRNRMVQEFTDVAFALPVGEVSEPVKTPFGYHLIQVTDEKLDDKGKRVEVRASHLLLKLHPSQATVEAMRERFYDFYERAETQGLEAAAGPDSFTVTETAPFQEGLNIPDVPNSLPGSNFAFSHEPGSLSPVFETDTDFYVVEVAQRLPAGHRPLDEVRSLVEAALQREQRADLAAQRLKEATDLVHAGKSFEEAAKATKLTYAVTDTFTLRQNIPEIGFGTAFARAAFQLDPGESLFDVRTQRGVYGIHLLWKSEFDEEEFQSRRSQIAQSLLFDRQRQVIEEWMEKLQGKAHIVDHRADLL
jgi:peptidyl-prolyl cis-trans isomerase D